MKRPMGSHDTKQKSGWPSTVSLQGTKYWRHAETKQGAGSATIGTSASIGRTLVDFVIRRRRESPSNLDRLAVGGCGSLLVAPKHTRDKDLLGVVYSASSLFEGSCPSTKRYCSPPPRKRDSSQRTEKGEDGRNFKGTSGVARNGCVSTTSNDYDSLDLFSQSCTALQHALPLPCIPHLR